MERRALAPFVAASLGLCGSLAVTLALYAAARDAVDRVLHERLAGAGESAASLLAGTPPTPTRLLDVMRANDLDGAYVVSRTLRVAADANGMSGRRADLLRVDPERLGRAFGGTSSVGPGYALGDLVVLAGYFPIRGPDRAVESVLVLEAGQSFVAPRTRLARARAIGVALSILSALGLGLAAARWARAERERRLAAEQSARAEGLSRVAAMAAHEIRNPLGVIRGTVDLMRERSGAVLAERDLAALGDIGEEVERLRQLTQDLLDLSNDRPLALAPVAVGEILAEVSRAAERSFPGIHVRLDGASLPPLEADGARLRQVFTNLLANAAQAQKEGEIFVSTVRRARAVSITVADQGPGVPAAAEARLFDLYFTTKSGGTGLGLAIARRLVEHHGGTIVYERNQPTGARFEVTLPLRSRSPSDGKGH